jgi:autophagy-related protein 11
VKYYMLEVEDWTQPGSSKRRQTSKKMSLVTDPREDSPVPLSAPPENDVEEESFHPTRAPNSRHFPAARTGSNATTPVAGPSSLSRLLAQAPATSEPPQLVEPTQSSPVTIVPSPRRTPSPQPAAASSSPTSSLPAAVAAARQHPPNPSSPLRPGSRASRLSTSSRFSAPRLPAFGVAGGSAPKAVPTTAITAPPSLDEPGTGAFGSSPTTTHLPADSASEGMAGLLARRRTTSFHVPASGSPLAAPVPRQTAGPAGALASLTSWGTSLRRRRTDAASSGGSPAATARTVTKQDAAPGKSDARQILQQF